MKSLEGAGFDPIHIDYNGESNPDVQPVPEILQNPVEEIDIFGPIDDLSPFDLHLRQHMIAEALKTKQGDAMRTALENQQRVIQEALGEE